MKYRKSKQREKILEVLQNTKIHPTANWLYDQIKPDFPNLSLGTVYRNLGILQEQGKIRKIEQGSTFDRYDANIDHHYHFICETCGAITDFKIDVNSDIKHQVENILNCHITGERLEFYGICKKCETK